jgi:3-deoxy-D-manno-octulosonate 8-phosphate phosphatase (KDO 8-P phosphatase)
MRAYDIIYKKREGQKLNKEELKFLINGYVNGDIPDYQIMQEVGVATCPEDAVEEIKSISDYISHKEGGKGAARDILQQVMKVQGKWMDGEAFHW